MVNPELLNNALQQYIHLVAYSLLPANEASGKVIFSEACVKNSVHRGRACLGGACWLVYAGGRGMHAQVGACVPRGWAFMPGGVCMPGACMPGGVCMHAWGMHAQGACLARGVGVYAQGVCMHGWGHAWWGACAVKGANMAKGGVHGEGGGVHGEGGVGCMGKGDVHGIHTPTPSMYASYWNVFLYCLQHSCGKVMFYTCL